ncbi:hypothetical protein [Neisseria meningitidis]|uniref:hypothetical protein n=1 Tax=Neisseria meningitidis TaxID=487 RepID=UPI00067AA7CF|nr:hypothetical protein [Neisseria meningitidis]
MCVVNGGQGVSILSGGVAAVISKNKCMANAKEKPLCRHSRAGGNLTVIPAQAGIQISMPQEFIGKSGI